METNRNGRIKVPTERDIKCNSLMELCKELEER